MSKRGVVAVGKAQFGIQHCTACMAYDEHALSICVGREARSGFHLCRRCASKLAEKLMARLVRKEETPS